MCVAASLVGGSSSPAPGSGVFKGETRVSVPPAIHNKFASHSDLKSGNRNNVKATLDGCSDTVWEKDSL